MGLVVACVALALAAPALAASHPKIGNYTGTSSSNVATAPALPFSFSVLHIKCPTAGSPATARHTAYCIDITGGTQVQRQCPDGTIGGAYVPLTTPIALSKAGTTSHTYTVYTDSGGQLYTNPLAGRTSVGTFALTLKVSPSGHATGSMNYSVSGCTSGVVSIAARAG